MKNLKTCPFCGGEPILEKAVMPNGKDEPIKLFKYKCRKCGVAEFGWPLSEEIGKEHWNRRISETCFKIDITTMDDLKIYDDRKYMCSECGKRIEADWDYCPHCGRKILE